MIFGVDITVAGFCVAVCVLGVVVFYFGYCFQDDKHYFGDADCHDEEEE